MLETITNQLKRDLLKGQEEFGPEEVWEASGQPEPTKVGRLYTVPESNDGYMGFSAAYMWRSKSSKKWIVINTYGEKDRFKYSSEAVDFLLKV